MELFGVVGGFVGFGEFFGVGFEVGVLVELVVVVGVDVLDDVGKVECFECVGDIVVVVGG